MGIEYFWKPVFVYESVVKILLLRRRRLVAMAHPANSGDPMRDQHNNNRSHRKNRDMPGPGLPGPKRLSGLRFRGL